MNIVITHAYSFKQSFWFPGCQICPGQFLDTSDRSRRHEGLGAKHTKWFEGHSGRHSEMYNSFGLEAKIT